MRLFLFIGGLFFIFLSIIGTIQTQREMEVYNYGKIVKMLILDIPNSCLGIISQYHMTVSHKEMNFVKRISGNYCEEHNVGDFEELKYLNGSNIVLFPYENPRSKIYIITFLGLVGLGIVLWYGVLKKPLINSRDK
jgi:hypothetical protein